MVDFSTSRTSQGHIVPLDSAPAASPSIWGRAEVSVGGELSARVWVALDMAPLLRETMQGIAFFGLSLLLAGCFILCRFIRCRSRKNASAPCFGELALTMQEEDRRRIARDLHDGAGQALTAARLRLLALSGTVGRCRQHHRDHQAARQCAKRSPTVCLFAVATGNHRAGTSRRAAKALRKLRICDGTESLLRTDRAAAAASQSRNRLLPHRARSARQQCKTRQSPSGVGSASAHDGSDLKLSVYDDGQAPQQPLGEGLGLLGIRERAKLLGGRAEITVDANRSFRVEVTLPLDEAAAPTVD